MDPAFPQGRNLVVAVQRGPFARVINTGSCLNLREYAHPDAKILGCYSDGVLFRDTGTAVTLEGQTWRSVEAPGGLSGWAATDFLEAAPARVTESDQP